MVNNKKILKEIRWKESEIGIAKKEEKMKAKGIDLSKNLLSVSAIVQNGGQVVFTKHEAEIKKDGKKFAAKQTEQGLWMVNLGESESETALMAKKTETVYDWHKKLGHLGAKNMKRLLKLSEGMNFEAEEIVKAVRNCETCLRAKQPCTWDKKRYMLTFLDDYTHFAVIYLLEGKYEVTELVKQYINMVEAKWQLRVSKLRSDNGREYLSKKLVEWCKGKGIVLDYTTPYTPQLNGKAERLNRTLIEKTRALLADAGADKTIWGEAARTATYLLNRSPTEETDLIPAEQWTKKRPNLRNIQQFGCNAYAKALGQLKKLDDRCEEYTFVGYAPNGYRLFDKIKKKIIISRDVAFTDLKQVDKESTTLKLTKESEDTQELENKTVEEEEEDFENEMHEPRNDEDTETEEDTIQENERKERNADRVSSKEQERSPRRGTRERKFPKRLKDYVLLTYEEAMERPDKALWKEAIEEKKKSMKRNDVWTLVPRTEAEDKRILNNKWIFKVKDDGRYKARLVVKGCEQKYGIDYEETFSPVVSMSSLRMILALATKKNKIIVKFDVKTAFLHGNLTEDTYMKIPKGYNKQLKKSANCKRLYTD
ncbi:gag-pol polyprotein [Lasius niger]|uniref:Gag-pol polyprotein n=1 Tax=Lasius niger TaxID=67767 RepID=A0A0J7K7L2_LASNI|nr:gag-pol polyprotein [Lasius niger]